MKNIISTIFVALANGEKFGSSEVSKDLKFGWDLKNVSFFLSIIGKRGDFLIPKKDCSHNKF